MPDPAAPQKTPGRLDQLLTEISRKVSDWSVELFVAIVIIGGVVGFWFAKPYIAIFNS